MPSELSSEDRKALDQDIAVDIGPDGRRPSAMIDDDAWLAVPVGNKLLFVLGGSPEGRKLTARPGLRTVAPNRVNTAVYLSTLPKALRRLVHQRLREALDK